MSVLNIQQFMNFYQKRKHDNIITLKIEKFFELRFKPLKKNFSFVNQKD